MGRTAKTAFALVALALSAIGCASKREATARIEVVDSVRTEIREVTQYVTDTVFLELPRQTEKRTAGDSLSVIETEFAVSTMMMHTDGTYTHEITNKLTSVPFQFQKPVTKRDSIVYRDVVVEKVVEVEREAKRGFWGRIAEKAFPWLMLVIIAIVLYEFATRRR